MTQFDLNNFEKNPDGSYSKKKTVLQPREKAMGKTMPQILKEQKNNGSLVERLIPHIDKQNIEEFRKQLKSVHFKNMSLDDVRIQCRQEGSIFILGNVPSLKNAKQIFRDHKTGNPYVTSSELCKKYLIDTRIQWNAFRGEFRRLSVGKQFPLKIQLFFVRDSHRTFDYGNISQIVWDCMTGNAYFPLTKNKEINKVRKEVRLDFAWIAEDDADHIMPDYSAGYGYDPKLAGVIIKIL